MNEQNKEPPGTLGTLLWSTPAHRDHRGYFMESWHRDKARQAGIPHDFVQDNISESKRNVLRGLHFQWPNPQGKLVHVLQGRILDVAVDLRTDSATFGRWRGVELSADDNRQFYIPEGYAHGFCVLSARALVLYKCTRVYDKTTEQCLAWNDPELAIRWPVMDPILSTKDASARCLSQFVATELPLSDPVGSGAVEAQINLNRGACV